MSDLRQKLDAAAHGKQIDLSTRKDYSFHDDVEKQIDAPTSWSNSGGRLYSIGDLKLPSVTTVLSATKSEEAKRSLQEWKDSVGEEEAARITKEAAARGNWLHNTVEHYLLDDERFAVPELNTNHYALWKQMYPQLQRIDNIRSIEGVLYSKKLGIAGRVDCVADFDDVPSIIDFKTTRTEKEESWITDYFLQTTLYALMYAEMHNTKIPQIVILMAKDRNIYGDAQVFIKKPMDYLRELLLRVRKYKKLKY